MKAYVIKNKEGKYYVHKWLGEDVFDEEIIYAQICGEDGIEIYKPSGDCTIVPITIFEGDPLKLACETIKLMCPTPYYICGGALADKLGIPMMVEPKDYDYFIQQAKEGE